MISPAADTGRTAEEMRTEIADLIRKHVFGSLESPKLIDEGISNATDAILAGPVARLLEAEKGAEAMRTELRPFATSEGEGLDEVVINGATTVHAETMSDTALWIGISDQHGGLVHVWANAVRRKGRLAIVMTATDEGDRGTIVQGSVLPAPVPSTEQEAGKP